jgi:hypothetical protein
VADEANDAAEDDDPLEDGEDSLYLTMPTHRSSSGTSSIIPPLGSGNSSPSAMESSLSGAASGVDDTSIQSDDSGPKLTAYSHSKRKRFP